MMAYELKVSILKKKDSNGCFLRNLSNIYLSFSFYYFLKSKGFLIILSQLISNQNEIWILQNHFEYINFFAWFYHTQYFWFDYSFDSIFLAFAKASALDLFDWIHFGSIHFCFLEFLNFEQAIKSFIIYWWQIHFASCLNHWFKNCYLRNIWMNFVIIYWFYCFS